MSLPFTEEIIYPVIVGLILLSVLVLLVFLVRSLRKINKKTKVVVLRYLHSIPKKKVKVIFSRLNGSKKVKDPWIPIIFGEPSNERESVFAVMVQNSDLKLSDNNIQIKIYFYDPGIERIEFPANKVEVREGGQKGSSFVC